ncbi:tyrosine-protein phosphatase [soil metagenome]
MEDLMTNPRILPLEGVENFRDYGGYAVRGGRIRSGQLFRAAHQARATPADLVAMSALKLATVVDLRRPRERDNDPSLRHDGFSAEVIQCDLGDQTEAPHVAFLRETDLTPESARAFFLDYYDKAPFEPRHLELFGRYFAALAAGAGPVLIHCTAGKDRTGLLAALTHHILGVHADDVREDYLLTNVAARVDERLPMITQALEKSLGKRPSETAVRAFLGVDALYLDAAFGSIAARSGSVEAYLDTIGADAAAREAIRARLIA